MAAVEELQQQGFAIPSYPINASNNDEESIKSRYDKIRGSAVNPVLREGNSDRRAPKAVKTYAQNNPHRMGTWSADSQSHVSSLSHGDFFDSESSVTVPNDTEITIQLVNDSGRTILKEGIVTQAGDVVDASFLSKDALCEFIEQEIEDSKNKGVLFSVHLKATMMKISDPIIFGHFVKIFYKEVFEKHQDVLTEFGVNANNGINDLYEKMELMDGKTRQSILDTIDSVYAHRPAMAMVDSDKGITNLHLPNNVIIDASMPAALRDSGKMWNADGKRQDAKFIIPDRSYAGIYQQVVDFCIANGAFDVSTMGSVSNVGLMAKKAEEYGSHDKTFELSQSGTVEVVDSNGHVLMSHTVGQGDIWRMCIVKDEPIQDWVKLAVARTRAVGAGVFWLDENRAHDNQLIAKVKTYLKSYDTAGLELSIKSPADAMQYSLDRIKAGLDTVSITGNVLRDYLTDLFPILELGTSAKMLSIVPLMKGGGLFETGAGGSAPKHVEQLVNDNYLRWDSLGEFLALAVSLEHVATVHSHDKARVLGNTLDEATTKLLQNNKSPARKLGKIDNRGSHFYLAMYWAQELAAQNTDADLKAEFSMLASQLAKSEDAIINEMNGVQRQKVDLLGYYNPNEDVCAKIMRPSQTFNNIVDAL
jgi:isocitrate dehydrogenase